MFDPVVPRCPALKLPSRFSIGKEKRLDGAGQNFTYSPNPTKPLAAENSPQKNPGAIGSHINKTRQGIRPFLLRPPTREGS